LRRCLNECSSSEEQHECHLVDGNQWHSYRCPTASQNSGLGKTLAKTLGRARVKVMGSRQWFDELRGRGKATTQHRGATRPLYTSGMQNEQRPPEAGAASGVTEEARPHLHLRRGCRWCARNRRSSRRRCSSSCCRHRGCRNGSCNRRAHLRRAAPPPQPPR